VIYLLSLSAGNSGQIYCKYSAANLPQILVKAFRILISAFLEFRKRRIVVFGRICRTTRPAYSM